MALTIRAARASDAPAIVGFWGPMVATTTVTFAPVAKTEAEIASLAEIAGLAEGADPFVVAVHDGAVVGFARCFAFRAGAGYGGRSSIP